MSGPKIRTSIVEHQLLVVCWFQFLVFSHSIDVLANALNRHTTMLKTKNQPRFLKFKYFQTNFEYAVI